MGLTLVLIAGLILVLVLSWRNSHQSTSTKLKKPFSNSDEIAMGAGFVVGVLGVLILSHAAHSTIQYRGLLKIMEEEFSAPPMNVVFELLVGFALCMWAGLTVPGKFMSITPDSDENRVVSLPANLDFMIFNHRGKVFHPETGLKLKI